MLPARRGSPLRLRRPLGPQRANGRAGLPHLALGDLGQFLLELRPVVAAADRLEDAPRLRAGLALVVQLLEDRLGGVAELLEPVERPALGGRRAVGVHPVHAVLGDERVQALRRLLDRLVERLGGRVAVGAEDFVLRQPQAVDRAHEDAALAGQVAVDFLLEGRLEQVARADGDAQRLGALGGLAGGVLEDGVAGVDALALEEEAADRRARPLGGDEDHVDVLGRHLAGLGVVDDAEAVGEVQRLALGQERLQGRPEVLLAGVAEQVLDDRAALGRLLEGEQGLARLPAVLDGLVPGARLLALADDDVAAVVLHVERLAGALDAVAQDGDDLVAEDLLDLLRRVVRALDDGFRLVTDLDLSHLLSSLRGFARAARLALNRSVYEIRAATAMVYFARASGASFRSGFFIRAPYTSFGGRFPWGQTSRSVRIRWQTWRSAATRIRR